MRAPRYEPNQARTAPLPSMQSNLKAPPPKDEGINFAEVGEKVFDFAAKQIDAFDKAHVAQADAEATQEMDRRITMAKSAKLGNAIGIEASQTEEFDKWVEERSKTMNGRQKTMFKNLAAKKRADMSSLLLQHELSESDKFFNQSYDAEVEAAKMEVAMMRPLGDKRVLEKINQSIEMATQYSDLSGKGPAWLKLEKMRLLSDMHSSVISSMISEGDVAGAKNWKQKYGRYIVEGSSRRLDTAIDNGVLRVEADNKAKELWSMGEEMAYEGIEEIPDPEMRKAVKDAVDDRRVTDARANAAREAELYKTARSQVMAGREVDPQIMIELSPEKQDDIARLRKSVKSGSTSKIKETAYSRYLNDARNAQEVFVNTDLLAARDAGDIDDIQLKTLESLQRSIKVGNPSAIKRLKNDANNSALMDREWKASGHKSNPDPNSKEGRKYQLFQTRVYEELDTAEAKGPLDLDKKTAIIQRLLKNDVYEWSAPSARGAVGGQGEIPPEFINVMMKKGVVDPDDIEYYWAAYQKGK